MPNTLVFDKEARAKLAKGADILAQAVVSTLGPRSRNVAINREWNGPLVVHDGVRVAQSIKLKDGYEDMGATLLKEAASNTNDQAGDGTTTATLLANTLIQEGLKLVGGDLNEGFTGNITNPMLLQEELRRYAEVIVKKIEERAQPATERGVYEQIATISSASKELGKLVADAIEKVGKDGVVMVEQSNSFESSLQLQEGMEFDNGYLSPYFVTDPHRMVADYGEAYVLISNHTITDPMQLVKIIEEVNKTGAKPLLIIANTVQGPALQWLIKTQQKGVQPVCAVNAPEWGERRKMMLEDIAILTGGNLVDADLNQKIEDVKIADLGRLRSFRVDELSTKIVPLHPDGEEILARISALREQLEKETNPMIAKRLESRLGKLTQGVAIINVGAPTVAEMQERVERVMDAVHAAKAALAEGILPGAGMTLYRIADEIAQSLSTEEQTPTWKLIDRMLRAPFRTIMRNSGFNADDVLKQIDERQKEGKEIIGFDVTDGKTHDLLSAGIIDPAKVTRLAIIHAMSVAGIVLTTDTLITKEDEHVQTMRIIQ